MKRFLLFLAMLTFYFDSFAQKELFENENKLKDCEINMPITGKKKDKESDARFVDSLTGVTLVYIFIDTKTRKTKHADPHFVYLKRGQLLDGSAGPFFTPLETTKINDRKIIYFKPDWNAKKYYKVYTADCYKSIVGK